MKGVLNISSDVTLSMGANGTQKSPINYCSLTIR